MLFSGNSRINGNLIPNGSFNEYPAVCGQQNASTIAQYDGTANGTQSPNRFRWAVNNAGAQNYAQFEPTGGRFGGGAVKLHLAAGQVIEMLSNNRSGVYGQKQRDDVSLAYGRTYRARYWMKTSLTGASTTKVGAFLMVGYEGTGWNVIGSTTVATTTDWTQYEILYTVTANHAYGYLRFYAYSDGPATLTGDIWITEVELEDITDDTRFDTNLIRNGSFDVRPTVSGQQNIVGVRQYDGTANGSLYQNRFQWSLSNSSASNYGQMDSSVSHNGRGTLKLHLAANSYIFAMSNGRPASLGLPTTGYLRLIKGHKYRLRYWLKTTLSGAATTGVAGQIIVTNNIGGYLGGVAGTAIKATTDWTQYEAYYTATEAQSYGYVQLYAYSDGTATLAGDAWFSEVELTDLSQIPRRKLCGNLALNGDFGDVPNPLTTPVLTTTDRGWIDGTASGSAARLKYGWMFARFGTQPLSGAGFDTTVKRSGTASMRLNQPNSPNAGEIVLAANNNTPQVAIQALDRSGMLELVNGHSYTIDFWIKTALTNNYNKGAFAIAYFQKADGSFYASQATAYQNGTTDWTKYTVSFTANAEMAYLGFEVRQDGETGDAWFDDIVITDLNCVGRTAVQKVQNLVPNSADMTDAGLSFSTVSGSTTMTATGLTDPLGSPVFRLTPDTANGYHRTFFNFESSLPAGTNVQNKPRYISAVFKADGYPCAWIYASNPDSQVDSIYVDLNTGAVRISVSSATSAFEMNPRIVSLGDGYWFVEVCTRNPIKTNVTQYGVNDVVAMHRVFTGNGTSGILVSSPCVSDSPFNLTHFVKTTGTLVNTGATRTSVC